MLLPITISLSIVCLILAGVCLWTFRKVRQPRLQLQETEELLKAAREDIRKLEKKSRVGEDYTSVQVIIDTIPHPAWVRDTDLKILYCNKAYYRVVGEDVHKNSHGEVTELCQQSKIIAQEVQDTDAYVQRQLHVISEGDRLLYRISEYPTDKGYSVGLAIDISAYEEIVQELQENRNLMSQLINSSGSAIAIYGPDQRIKFFNKAHLQMWGMEKEWLDNQPTIGEILDHLRTIRRLPEQEDFKKYREFVISLFTMQMDQTEYRHYMPDGRILRVVAFPHEDGGLLFSTDDVTEYMDLERSYNTLNEVKATTIDNLQEGLAVVGSDGRLQLINPEYRKIWDISKDWQNLNPHIDQLLENLHSHFLSETQWEDYRILLLAALYKHKSDEVQLELKNGIVLKTFFIPLPDGALLISQLDISDTSRIERSLRAEKEALEEADRLKTSFLANVSYELRSPLTSINGYAEALLENYFGKLNPSQHEHMEDILCASARLGSLIDNMLDMASLEAGLMRLHVETFDLQEEIRNICKQLYTLANEKDISLNTAYLSDAVLLIGDRKRLREVFMQIIRNAIHYSDSHESVDISISKSDNKHIIIKVRDEGCGIASDEQPYVFEKFYKTKNNSYTGTGIGLTLAKNIIELHGGTISLQSALGKGTTIECSLPCDNWALLKREEKSGLISILH